MTTNIKVDILTFHASHNFGSVMQAYALQRYILSKGYDCKIVNYRPKSQKDKYSVFPLHNGLIPLVRFFLQISHLPEKIRYYRKYETFISSHLLLTKEVNKKSELNYLEQYDILISGSDQIWAYSIPEFLTSKEDIRSVYYWAFADGYKISYASSTGSASPKDLMLYKEFMKDFSSISTRENSGKRIVEELTGKNVEVVLDPTYLLSTNDWRKFSDSIPRVCKDDYILIYTLQGRKKNKEWKRLIEKISLVYGKKIITINPFIPIKIFCCSDMSYSGPVEILNLFANAEYVFTDTFHGMTFSIHFRKPFTVFENNKLDSRKQNTLEMFSMMDRVAYNINECLEMYKKGHSYEFINPSIEKMVNKSKEYLLNSLTSYEKENSI